MKKLQKFLCVLLAVLMTVTAAPMGVLADISMPDFSVYAKATNEEDFEFDQ